MIKHSINGPFSETSPSACPLSKNPSKSSLCLVELSHCITTARGTWRYRELSVREPNDDLTEDEAEEDDSQLRGWS